MPLARHDRAWLAVLLAYVAIFGGILVYSDFLPFTFDNNESFSAFWHARNLFEYGIANSSGLADEAFSYSAAAHPYAYTHAGASPRLFAYLLYVVGIRTVEAQITFTVFSVGLAAFWLAYRFLAEVATRFYAVVACLLLMTDYLMFAQWHVDAWQVWKALFVFAGLYLAHRIVVNRQPRPLLALYAFHAFLFYYETIFNVFVALLVFLYFLFSTRNYRFALKVASAQAAGALTAAVVLLGQCIWQFGWDVVATDIDYTFIGRNFAADALALSQAAKAFYADHNIIFWMNVPDTTQYRTVKQTLRVLFQDHSVHTPIWSFVVLAFVAAELIRRFRRPLDPVKPASGAGYTIVPATFLLGASLAALLGVLVRNPEVGAGLAPLTPFWASRSWLTLCFAGGLISAAPFVFAPRLLQLAGAGRILGAGLFVAGALALLLMQRRVYSAALEPIWRAALDHMGGYSVAGALFVVAMVAVSAWRAFGGSAGRGESSRLSGRLLVALAAMLTAYVLVYLVFPGYVQNGYSARYAPFTIYFNALLLAVGLTAMIDCARSLYVSFRESASWQRTVYAAGSCTAAFGVAGVLLYWGALQAFLFKKLPPDSISFFPLLSSPPFRGSSFAALAYGGVVAYFTKSWAYFDYNSTLAQGRVTLGPDGYRVERDNTYVWFADRATNPAYDKPAYYLTMTYQGLGLANLTDGKLAPLPRVGEVPLIRAIREGRTEYLHPVEVARDPSPRDRWSIVRFDWDFPPFLRPIADGETVGVNVSPARNGTRIRVDYQYAHQEHVPEAGTRVALFAQTGCKEFGNGIAVEPAATSAREFALPRNFAGTVRAEVQPATATKVGPSYRSRAIPIGTQKKC